MILHLLLLFSFHLFSQDFPGYVIMDKNLCSIEANKFKNLNYFNYLSSEKFSFDNEIQEFIKYFLPFNKFMEVSLYDKSFGYYSTGQVKFNGHFYTYPEFMSPNYGAMIAYLAYAMWISMINSNDMNDNENFTLLEFGAGNGILSKDILDTIEKYADQEVKLNLNTKWQKFNSVVKYIIVEKSESLIQKQKNINEKYLRSKLKIIYSDACYLNNLELRIKGLVLSNELIDAFAVHKMLQKNQKSYCNVLVIELTKNWLKNLELEIANDLLNKSVTLTKLISHLLQNNEEFKKINRDSFTENPDVIRLSFQDWYKIRLSLINNYKLKDFDSNIAFVEYYVNAKYFQETENYIRKFANHLNEVENNCLLFRKNCIWYLNYLSENYYQNVSMLLEKGFLLTIDYGSNFKIHLRQAMDKNNAFRTFPKNDDLENKNFIYKNIGSIDLTSDVNFTDLSLVGKKYKFDTLFFGSQSNLSYNKLRISNSNYLVSFDFKNNKFVDMDNYEKLNKYKSFKMMIQKKVDTNNCFEILTNSENLFE